MEKLLRKKNFYKALFHLLLVIISQIGMMLLLSSEVLAKSDRGATEAGSDISCNCSTQVQNVVFNRKSLEAMARVIDKASKPTYYWKYHIDKFMEEVVEKSPQSQVQVEETIAKLLSNIPEQTRENIANISYDKKASRGSADVVLTQILSDLARQVPGVQKIVDAYVVKLQFNGQATDNGLVVGQQKTISFETNKSRHSYHMGVSYSFCNDSTTILNMGVKSTCDPASQPTTGDTPQDAINRGLNMVNLIPEVQIFLKVQY